MVKTLAEILRERITASGQSINAIARGSGVPQPALNWFFKGERDLTLRTVTKLAKYLGLEMRPRDTTEDSDGAANRQREQAIVEN